MYTKDRDSAGTDELDEFYCTCITPDDTYVVGEIYTLILAGKGFLLIDSVWC